MKAKKIDWWKQASNLVFVLCFALCIMFFITLVTSIVVFNTPYVVVNIKEATGFFITLILTITLPVVCMLFLFNSDERDAIDDLRVYDDTRKIREKAIKNAMKVYAKSAVITIIALGNYFLIDSCKVSLLNFTGKIVLMRISIFVTFAAVILFVLSLLAYTSALKKYDQTKDVVLEWENLLLDVDEIAYKEAKKALEDSEFVDVYKSAARKKILELDLIKKFPEHEGILQVYVGSVFDKVFNEKKWVYVWEATGLPLFFNNKKIDINIQ